MAAIRKVPARERITQPDGRPYPPGGPSPRGPMPTEANYTCPECGQVHPLDIDRIGNTLWDQKYPDKTAFRDLDRKGQGEDVVCRCGLIARVVPTITEWGKMGSYYTAFVTVFERLP